MRTWGDDAVKAMWYWAGLQRAELFRGERPNLRIDLKQITLILRILFDQGYMELVEEAPGMPTEEILTRVLSGDDDLKKDVEIILRSDVADLILDMQDQLAAPTPH